MKLQYGEAEEAFRAELIAWLEEHAPPEKLLREPRLSSANLTDWGREWQRTLTFLDDLVAEWSSTRPVARLTYENLFGDDFRFHSSGCVRVQNVRQLVAWLLDETHGWSPEEIDRVIKSGERKDAHLAKPVPLHWVYVTAWSASDGVVTVTHVSPSRASSSRAGQPNVNETTSGASSCISASFASQSSSS